MNEYLFEISIEGEGERLRYIPISADNLKQARVLFAEKITTREFWLFAVFRRLN